MHDRECIYELRSFSHTFLDRLLMMEDTLFILPHELKSCYLTFRHVWNTWGKTNNTLAHDSVFCKQFPPTMGFPTKRKNEPNNYVASIVKKNVIFWEVCPEACRRHVQWDHC